MSIDYPAPTLYFPAGPIADWSTDAAQAYCDAWLREIPSGVARITVYHARATGQVALLTPARANLDTIFRWVCAAVPTRVARTNELPYGFEVKRGQEPRRVANGAMVFDLGCFVGATMLAEIKGASIHPCPHEGDLNFNLPVLKGFRNAPCPLTVASNSVSRHLREPDLPISLAAAFDAILLGR